MSYRVHAEEALPDAIRRVVIERIREAGDALADTAQPDQGIHDARKRFKEIRAVVRLIRPVLGKRFHAENIRFRDLGRALSVSRDAQALIETFDKLTERFPDELQGSAGAELRAQLVTRRDAQTGGDAQPNLERLRIALIDAERDVADWPLSAMGFDALGAGLRKSYRDGRKQLAIAYQVGDDVTFHEWRKRVKDQWYHTKLLRSLWDDGLRGRQKTLKELSDLLGDDHDLSVLRGVLRADAPAVSGDTAAIVAMIMRRQAELRVAARPLGLRLYAEKPSAYAKRMGRYWAVLDGRTAAW